MKFCCFFCCFCFLLFLFFVCVSFRFKEKKKHEIIWHAARADSQRANEWLMDKRIEFSEMTTLKLLLRVLIWTRQHHRYVCELVNFLTIKITWWTAGTRIECPLECFETFKSGEWLHGMLHKKMTVQPSKSVSCIPLCPRSFVGIFIFTQIQLIKFASVIFNRMCVHQYSNQFHWQPYHCIIPPANIWSKVRLTTTTTNVEKNKYW